MEQYLVYLLKYFNFICPTSERRLVPMRASDEKNGAGRMRGYLTSGPLAGEFKIVSILRALGTGRIANSDRKVGIALSK